MISVQLGQLRNETLEADGRLINNISFLSIQHRQSANELRNESQELEIELRSKDVMISEQLGQHILAISQIVRWGYLHLPLLDRHKCVPQRSHLWSWRGVH